MLGIPEILVLSLLLTVIFLAIGWFLLRASESQKFGIVDTGIKAVDLIAPLPEVGQVLITGEPRAGARVLGTELAYRLATTVTRPYRLLIYLDEGLDDIESFCKELRETLPNIHSIYVSPRITANQIQQDRLSSATNKRDAVFAFSKDPEFIRSFLAALKSEPIGAKGQSSLLSVVVTEGDIDGEFDAKLVSRKRLADQTIYPALDVNASTSRRLQELPLTSRRLSISNRLKSSLKEVIETLQPGIIEDTGWVFNRDPQKIPAAQALWFLSQPFYTAEPYTGMKAATLSISETTNDFEVILSGKLASKPLREFLFKNSLP